jgi:hypothetical protein
MTCDRLRFPAGVEPHMLVSGTSVQNPLKENGGLTWQS